MTDLETSTCSLAFLLQQLKSRDLRDQLGGEELMVQSGSTFDNHSPVDGSWICDVPDSSALDIDKAATAARKAFPAWRDTNARERKHIHYRIADMIWVNSEMSGTC